MTARTLEQLQVLARDFMVREYGAPSSLDEESRDRWHEKLGLLVSFIHEVVRR